MITTIIQIVLPAIHLNLNQDHADKKAKRQITFLALTARLPEVLRCMQLDMDNTIPLATFHPVNY
jgi:hypothetical protein